MTSLNVQITKRIKEIRERGTAFQAGELLPVLDVSIPLLMGSSSLKQEFRERQFFVISDLLLVSGSHHQYVITQKLFFHVVFV